MTSELETHFRAPREPLVGRRVDLHARDMTATFAADVTLGDAQRKLADIGQWLPVDGPARQAWADWWTSTQRGRSAWATALARPAAGLPVHQRGGVS